MGQIFYFFMESTSWETFSIQSTRDLLHNKLKKANNLNISNLNLQNRSIYNTKYLANIL